MQLELVIASEESRESRPLAPGVVTIGRGDECTVRLAGHLISRRHATLEVLGDTLRVVDSSCNGTLAGAVFVNDRAVDVPLDTPLTIGQYTLSVRGPERTASGTERTAPESAAPAAESPAPTLAASPEVTPRAEPEPPAGPPLAGALEHGSERAQAAEQEAEAVAVRREIHRLLLEHLDLGAIEAGKHDSPALRPRVLSALRQIVRELDARIAAGVNRDALVGELVDEALGLGPLEKFLSDPSVSEIMVVDPDTIYLEQRGKLTRSGARFTDDERVRAVIERIVTPLGRRIDESSPLVDARLRDGSRVNAVIPPLALRGSAITIRKFQKTPLTLENLVEFGALTQAMGRFLTRSVAAKRNIVIAGGTGSGKTTLLNVLSAAIPAGERIVTIEDAAELRLGQPHVVSLETRPANMEGKGEYSIRDLVKNALRMRPDRIVVGECRGGEALDMLQAMNTGHDGSLTTTHANSAREAIARLETLVLMSGLDLPVRAIREQIAGAVHVIVQQSRLSDGSRKVTAITEVTGVNDQGEVELLPIFRYVRSGTGEQGKVLGDFQATGFLPTFLHEFQLMGLLAPGERFL